ncbi:hypothetical protein [Aridibaculum aurantiacum]|uniref:hypothetical protein n=1 Tax=Aridibaculum aurantiacum TaxID=2810307 RepID=UPI001A977704|nr:hypothetical protein [Aridibaculum aurantiacum]
MIQEKAAFLKDQLVPLLQNLDPAQKPNWGKMDAQQMVEHMADAFAIANGNQAMPLHTTDADRLQKMRAFIVSDIPFKEGTRNPIMAEEPVPCRYESFSLAIEKLEIELQQFFSVYEKDAGLQILNPVFGELNYMQQVHLLHKHAVHHLKQFGLL